MKTNMFEIYCRKGGKLRELSCWLQYTPIVLMSCDCNYVQKMYLCPPIIESSNIVHDFFNSYAIIIIGQTI